MAKEKKLILVKFEDNRFKISFRGLWMRKEIDLAYGAILRELPKHIKEYKEKIIEQEV